MQKILKFNVGQTFELAKYDPWFIGTWSIDL